MTGKKFRAVMKSIPVLPLLFLGTPSAISTAVAQSAGTFTATGNMTTARSFHTATLLLDGTVLIAGGSRYSSGSFVGSTLASAEVYDPQTETFTAARSMTTARRLHTATLLPDDRVLIAGGYGDNVVRLASAELYDPSTGIFTATGDMVTAQGGHTATLLPNGKVLIAGGDTLYPTAVYVTVSPAEVYDPSTGTFAPTGPYAATGECDFCPPSVLLPNGSVLFAGQYPAQLYDAVSDAFSRTAAVLDPDHSTATLLMNGKVLFAGGVSEGRSSTAELYDPATGTFHFTGSMASARVWHTATLLPDGTALIAGGEGGASGFTGSMASAELYDSCSGTFHPTGSMTVRREVHTATLLDDGRVLIAGGESYGGIGVFFGSLASAELYTPPVLVPAPVFLSVSRGGRDQGAIVHASTHQAVSSDNPVAAGEVLEIYLLGLIEGSVIPPQVTIGNRMRSSILARLPDGRGLIK